MRKHYIFYLFFQIFNNKKTAQTTPKAIIAICIDVTKSRPEKEICSIGFAYLLSKPTPIKNQFFTGNLIWGNFF